MNGIYDELFARKRAGNSHWEAESTDNIYYLGRLMSGPVV